METYVCLGMNKSTLYKGCLEPIIMRLLKDNGRMYGYQITQMVKEITKGELQITEGALYPLLHKLEEQGILETELENVGNRVRKYYSLTKAGKKQKCAKWVASRRENYTYIFCIFPLMHLVAPLNAVVRLQVHVQVRSMHIYMQIRAIGCGVVRPGAGQVKCFIAQLQMWTHVVFHMLNTYTCIY